MNAAERNDAGNPAAVPPPEEFVLIQGGTFRMGSPEEEAWRSEDEVLPYEQDKDISGHLGDQLP